MSIWQINVRNVPLGTFPNPKFAEADTAEEAAAVLTERSVDWLQKGYGEITSVVPYEGRMARCSCGEMQPSSPDLFGLTDLSADGARASETCGTCRYSIVAHTDEIRSRPNSRVCDDFIPLGGQEFDSFYCGCRGWD
jgi:hypothetical protein